MSVPSSVAELLLLIRKSGMIDESRLATYLLRRTVGAEVPEDPRDASDAMVRDGLLTAFQAEQFLLGKWRGFTIGKYKLLERVGVGGMGQVFLCEHMFMKRRVAIKVLPPAKAEQPAALGRFYREARAAGSLEHPNIVRTHDIDQDGNLHFIVMEYVDGANLLDIVKKFGPLDIGRAVHYIRKVALGLDFAFRGGIIHRDIKPGNILVDRVGAIKLLDLGLARFYKDTTDMLTLKYDDKIVLGTADYVAPEQVANSHAVDVRADIYALGASFYFVLAGHPPFPNGTVSQKLLWHRTKDPTPIRQIRPEVPEGLAAILAKMMHKDANRRFATPAELVEALEIWDPAEVAAPAPEEMPKLSPAALEGVEPPIEPYVPPSSKLLSKLLESGELPLSEMRRRLSAKPSPFGVPAAEPVSELRGKPAPKTAAFSVTAAEPVSELRSKLAPKASPFGVPSAIAEAPATGTPPPNSTGFNPNYSTASYISSPSGKSNIGTRTKPFAAPQAEVDTTALLQDPTPQNVSRPQYRTTLGTIPIIAMPPLNTGSRKRKVIFFGLLATCAAVATILLTWKFLVASKSVGLAPGAHVESMQI